ncbi:hypothetical protein [Streptomyces longisporoflavus]|uniref:Uncharacterized protein n=1 Tax=Streptomyces longisporoflavus TaxID=28044 RepID=A0ABW7R3Q8_9ACTN
MDAVTQVALIGVAGTAVAGFAGMVGAVRAAGVSARGQAALEDSKLRRAAYSSCATSLIVRRDAVCALMEAMRSNSIGPDAARVELPRAQTMRAGVMRTIGAVVVEGPAWLADAAESAARHLDVWLDGLAYWIGEDLPDRMRDREQWDNRQADRLLSEQAIERFARGCRLIVHPRAGPPTAPLVSVRRLAGLRSPPSAEPHVGTRAYRSLVRPVAGEGCARRPRAVRPGLPRRTGPSTPAARLAHLATCSGGSAMTFTDSATVEAHSGRLQCTGEAATPRSG